MIRTPKTDVDRALLSLILFPSTFCVLSWWIYSKNFAFNLNNNNLNFQTIFRSSTCSWLSLWITLIISLGIGQFLGLTIWTSLSDFGQNTIRMQRDALSIWMSLLWCVKFLHLLGSESYVHIVWRVSVWWVFSFKLIRPFFCNLKCYNFRWAWTCPLIAMARCFLMPLCLPLFVLPLKLKPMVILTMLMESWELLSSKSGRELVQNYWIR